MDTNNWVKYLETIIFNYNNCVHRATNIKPYVLYYAYDPSCIIYLQQLNAIEDRETIRRNISDYTRNWVDQYNNRTQQNIIQIGDRVLIAKRFNLERGVRRDEYLNSFYEEGVWIIQEIGVYDYLVRKENDNITRRAYRNMVKKYL